MRYFTIETLDYDVSEFNVVKKRYWENISIIRSKIPQELYELHRNYSLHDGLIVSVCEIKRGKDIGIVIEGFANGHVGGSDQCVFFLHFVDVYSGSLDQAIDREIHIAEVDIDDNGYSVLRLLHRDSECDYLEDELVFKDFYFYKHNSRSPR